MKPKIGELRKSKGLTQKYVAQQVEISYQRLSEIERGVIYPRVDLLKKIGDAIGENWCDLYEDK
ncbi:helix-turn-helix transcriptional regulator [Halobacillus aidingensis]|uniref:DNA-binding transcriptional regulator, XRE-family HTH domain n=1 Tax=Halobacillus aidingensis TaxID=240303 RepID=A0A1H0MEK4_HALAD|nr:helix-turn-helix transcriptional regulator [Halobacillus aidingensis]SDO78620.1 DNA-binding transcriptional regulator, XRE-family HTH domain [Halobacillus aidingensis]